MSVREYLGRLVEHFDGWQNILTGLGTVRDKSNATTFGIGNWLQYEELEALYGQDDTARKIVSFKPNEMFRQSYTATLGDAAADKVLTDYCGRLNVDGVLLDGILWGRLYGGCVAVVGADDGQDPALALNERAIATVRYLQLASRRYVTPRDLDMDPRSATYGQPATYDVGGLGTPNKRVHRSRMLFFPGAKTTPEDKARNQGWDRSVLDAPYQALRAYNTAWLAAEHLMNDASQGVFRIKGLLGMLSGGQKDLLTTRMQIVDLTRSVARAIMLDADGEDYKRENTSFTEASNMLDKFMLRVASAAEIPVTILMGQSPAGMNATGEADFRAFYDTVASSQTRELKPLLQAAHRFILLAKDGPTRGQPPTTYEIEFTPLWKESPGQRAITQKTIAETDVAYINADVVSPEEVALSRFKPHGFDLPLSIDLTSRQAALEPTEAEPGEVEELQPTTPTETRMTELAPTDLASCITVNEVRAERGYGNVPDGELMVSVYRAKYEMAGETVGAEVATVGDNDAPKI